MSCATLNSGLVALNVSMASLPEGFCPATIQELANAIAGRLVVTPNQSFTSFAVGSVEPSTNVGPWFKDCVTFFVYDDATASYVPMTKGGFNTEEYKTTTGTFTVPLFIYKLRVHVWGGGGGGGNAAGTQSGGGGGGGFALGILNVLPGQVIPFTIGTGGANGAPGANGGASTFLTLTANGGVGGTAPNEGGAGGTGTGGDMNVTGQVGSYGWSAALAGNGGDSPQGGAGGVFSTATVGNLTGKLPGGGGAGGLNGVNGSVGGSGAGGAILIEY